MTEEELAHIETLCNAATPGEWYLVSRDVFTTHSRSYSKIAASFDEGGRDAAFIAASREAVPTLVAELMVTRSIVQDPGV